jgi:hypothetical protein
MAFAGNVANPSRQALDSDVLHPIATYMSSVISGAPINRDDLPKPISVEGMSVSIDEPNCGQLRRLPLHEQH